MPASISRNDSAAGALLTRFTAAPVVPRPAKVELGPRAISTCSRAKISRAMTPGSRTPSTNTSLRASKPRMMKRSPKALPPSPVPMVTPGRVRMMSRSEVAPESRITWRGIAVIDLEISMMGRVNLPDCRRSTL